MTKSSKSDKKLSDGLPTRTILGVNCALQPFGLALVRDDGKNKTVLVDQTIQTQGSAIENLIEVIDQLCQDVGVMLSDIDEVGILKGPGSYTAMRLSVTVVKTLAQLYQCRLVGLSTLEHLVWLYRGKPGVYAAVFHARADQYNAALFGVQKKNGSLSTIKRITDDFLWTESELLNFVSQQKGAMTFVGQLPESIVAQFGQTSTASLSTPRIDYLETSISARQVAFQVLDVGLTSNSDEGSRSALDVYYPTGV